MKRYRSGSLLIILLVKTLRIPCPDMFTCTVKKYFFQLQEDEKVSIEHEATSAPVKISLLRNVTRRHCMIIPHRKVLVTRTHSNV